MIENQPTQIEQISENVGCEEPGKESPGVTLEQRDEKRSMRFLTLVLRGIGAGLLWTSVSTFMLQRWETGSDIHRYYMLLGHTVFLCIIAIFCGLRINEGRSARIFLGLILGSIPVHFTVLGGLLYSRFQWDQVALQIPLHAIWVAPSSTSALFTTTVGFLVLAPLCFVSMLALARAHAVRLSIVYMLINSTILLPLRSADATGIIVILLFILFLLLESRYFTSKSALQTVEGKYIRLMMTLPLVLIIGRTISLYNITLIFFGSILMGASISVFFLTPRFFRELSEQRLSQGVSAVVGSIGIYLMASGLDENWQLASYLFIPLWVLPCIVLLIIMSFICIGNGNGYRSTAAALAIFSLGYNLYVFGNVWSSILCLFASSTAAAYAAFVRNKTIMLIGGVGVVFGLGYHMYYAISSSTIVNWGSLTVIGGTLIIVASLFERNSNKIMYVINKARKRYHFEAMDQ